jgi:hypothetical protein
MKYFTFDWWSGLNEDETAASRYWAYLDSVRGLLPPAIQRFHEGCTLHDSEVIELRVEPMEARAVLSLAGSSLDGGPCNYRLEYLGLASFVTRNAKGDGPLGGPIGFDEFEVLPEGHTEHRLLFSSGIEVELRFQDFRFTCQQPR